MATSPPIAHPREGQRIDGGDEAIAPAPELLSAQALVRILALTGRRNERERESG